MVIQFDFVNINGGMSTSSAHIYHVCTAHDVRVVALVQARRGELEGGKPKTFMHCRSWGSVRINEVPEDRV
jgi:hypothetical protein